MNNTNLQLLIPMASLFGTLAVVVVGFLYNNSRISDLRSDFNSRFGDLNTRFGDLRDIIRANSEKQDANLRRVEDMLLGKFAELDNRLSRIERHLNL